MRVEASVYTVEKKDGKTLVRDEVAAKVIYSSSDDGYVVYQVDGGKTEVSKVKDLSDVQLLKALANAVSLSGK